MTEKSVIHLTLDYEEAWLLAQMSSVGAAACAFQRAESGSERELRAVRALDQVTIETLAGMAVDPLAIPRFRALQDRFAALIGAAWPEAEVERRGV